MKSRKPSAPSKPVVSNLVVLARDSELLFTDTETTVLIIGGVCHVRHARGELERVNAGSVLVRRGRSQARDARVTRALELMRTHPDRRWTVETLARAVGLSRAVFGRRFTAFTGTSPLRYLTELRLALAAASLAHEDDSALAALAARVGYASEFSFSRAFKRRYGVAPGTFRRTSNLPPNRTLALAA